MSEELTQRWNEDYAEDWVTKVLPRLVYAPALIQPELGRLLGDVRGQRILDSGCGEGVYARYLTDAGATVVGIDGSAKMVAFAREKDPRIDFRVANLLEPLAFEDGSFDAVVSSGVLMSLPRLDTFLSESFRILKRQGVLVVSVHHPAFSNPTMTLHHPFWARWLGRPPVGLSFSYFDKGQNGSGKARWPFHHRTIGEYVDAFRQQGFLLDRITEPHDLPREILETNDVEYVTRLPRFIFFRMVKA